MLGRATRREARKENHSGEMIFDAADDFVDLRRSKNEGRKSYKIGDRCEVGEQVCLRAIRNKTRRELPPLE